MNDIKRALTATAARDKASVMSATSTDGSGPAAVTKASDTSEPVDVMASTGVDTTVAASLLAVMALVGTGCVFARYEWSRE